MRALEAGARRGRWPWIAGVGLGALAIAAIVYVFAQRPRVQPPRLFTVQEGPLEITLTETGVLEAKPAAAEETVMVEMEAVAEVEAPSVPSVEAAAPAPMEIEEVAAAAAAQPGLSPEELALLALEEEEEELAELEEEEAEGEEVSEEVWKVPVVATGAGQIRFAEDIMGDFRGRGRRGRGGGQEGGKGKKGVKGKGAQVQANQGGR